MPHLSGCKLSPALTRSFALPPARANLCPPSRCRNYPLSRQASSRFTHIPYIPPLRGCRSDQRNSCKNMAGWRCPRLYLLWELSRDSSLAQLITISLCLPYSLLSQSGVVLFLSISSIFLVHQFLSKSHSIVPCVASCPLDSLSLACQGFLCTDCRWGFADEAIYMHTQSFFIEHGQARYDLHHHSPYLQILS